MFLKDQIVGKYRIIKSLGTGGFGSVYLAEDTIISKLVALKVPHNQNQEKDKLTIEAKLMAPLSHPNIVSVLTAEVDPETEIFYIVMEYVDGESLAERLAKVQCLDEAKAIGFSIEITDAVCYAHKQNILHRDLRPSNVLLTKDDIAKVTDFSISRLLKDDESYASTRIGSPPYMAPEHFQGRATYASDVYSIGVMMYEMITGTLPFFDISPQKIEELVSLGRFTPPIIRKKSVSKEFNEIIVRAMARDMSQRYKSAADLLLDLKKLRHSPLKEREIQEIRDRIRFREEAKESFCFNCRRPLPKRASRCPSCGQKQD
ncbi:MAG: serine/threonine protein kinase [Thermoanaerobaculaceae bacterium]|nr:serine/threonine protein kinase [Thermoanaerobaculaceae bacterium]